jgi:hypothetical protein
MTLEKLQETLNTIRRGTYFHLVFKKQYGEYVRTTKTIGRLVKYANTKKAKERKALNPTKETKTNPNNQYLGNNIIFNTNTQKTCLQVFLTNCKYHKPISVYEHLNEEITMEEFYEGTNKKPSEPSELMNIDINDIVAIY